MIAQIPFGSEHRAVDLSRPLPIHIPLRHGAQNPNAWYASPPSFEAFRMGDFLGSVAEGGSVNTNDIRFNPHGNGTHTESMGHLMKQPIMIDESLQLHHFWAQIISLETQTWDGPESEFQKRGDTLLTASQLDDIKWSEEVKALIIRTIPNGPEKKTRSYTGQNPTYLEPAFMDILVEHGIEHLLIDLPSVDRESDGGKMLAHRAFWQTDSSSPRLQASITEMIYVDEVILDGLYLLNLLPAPFHNDAAPSRPALYSIIDGH